MIAGEPEEERRKYERFVVTSHAVVLSSTTFGQLIDISRDGLAFSYLCDGRDEEGAAESFELSLLCGRDGFFLDSVPCRTVSDRVMAEGLPPDLARVRRRGVQFGPLTPSQAAKLEHFMWHGGRGAGQGQHPHATVA